MEEGSLSVIEHWKMWKGWTDQMARRIGGHAGGRCRAVILSRNLDEAGGDRSEVDSTDVVWRAVYGIGVVSLMVTASELVGLISGRKGSGQAGFWVHGNAESGDL